MAAPKGNEFWKKRSTHGRKKIFQTPEILWEACCEYFEYQSSRELVKVDFRGKDAERVKIPTTPPFTMQGLTLFLDVNMKYFDDFEKNLDKSTEEGKDFSQVITRVKQIVFNQKFEGASVGIYNSNIIARELGLTDKKDITATVEQPLFPED